MKGTEEDERRRGKRQDNMGKYGGKKERNLGKPWRKGGGEGIEENMDERKGRRGGMRKIDNQIKRVLMVL